MNFQHANPHNVAWLVPSWACEQFALAKALDGIFDGLKRLGRIKKWDGHFDFYVVCKRHSGDDLTLEVFDCEQSDEVLARGRLIIDHSDWQIGVPVNLMIKGAPPAAGMHCVYQHSFQTETPLSYVGITKRRWFDRLADHLSSARRGSPYLFHRAIREHPECRMTHYLLLDGSGEEAALEVEEEFVSLISLYTLGLNMIPGGKSGISYLHRLGLIARSAEERDATVERLSAEPSIKGKPNPLCSARWEQDQDFVNRVVCGHSGRLTAEQVRQIRALANVGMSQSSISAQTDIATIKIRNVLSGKRYGRVA